MEHERVRNPIVLEQALAPHVHEVIVVCDEIGTEDRQKYVCNGECPGEGLVVEGEVDVDVAVRFNPRVVGRSHGFCGRLPFFAECVQEQGTCGSRVDEKAVAQVLIF